MSGRYDAVIVGAGHNGLAAAAYLAKAGRSVLVLERSTWVGGTVHTEEFAPGFRASAAFQSAETLSPKVIKELGLKAHGLVLSPAGGVALATAGGMLRFDGKGRPVQGVGAAKSGAGDAGALLSGADSVALRELERFIGRLVATLAPLYDAPLPELERLGVGDKFDLLRIGWRLRRMGRGDMQAAMRGLPMSMRDFAEDHLDGTAVCALLAGLGSPGGCPGPYAAGTVFRALHDQMANPRPLFAGPVLPQGGMGALGDALAAAARAAGAEVRTESEVERIEIDGGEARGVTLTSGGHIEAGVVVSDADPRRTLLTLVDAATLRPEFVFAAQCIRARAGVALVSFALDGLPDAGSDTSALAGRIQIGASLPDVERAFDAAPMGALPQRPLVHLMFPTISDAGLAEDDKHVATAWVQAVPREIRVEDSDGGDSGDGGDGGDGWGAGREALARSVVAVIDEVLPGFSDRIVAHKVTAPPDFEERFGVTNGCLFGADLTLDQALYLRPLPGWYGYRTPVHGLYLCGSGTHGGGGITGLAGRNAAQRVLADAKSAATGRSG